MMDDRSVPQSGERVPSWAVRGLLDDVVHAYERNGLATFVDPHMAQGLGVLEKAGLTGLELLSPGGDVMEAKDASARLGRALTDKDLLAATIAGLDLTGAMAAIFLPGHYSQYKNGVGLLMHLADEMPRGGLLSIVRNEGAAGGGGRGPALDMSEAARMQRAREMGYDPSERFYTAQPTGQTSFPLGTYFACDRDYAVGRAEKTGRPVYEMLLKRERPFMQHQGYTISDFNRIAQATRDEYGAEAGNRIASALPVSGVQINNLDDLALIAKKHGQLSGISGSLIMNLLKSQFGTAWPVLARAGYDAADTGSGDLVKLTDKGSRSVDAVFDPAQASSPNIYRVLAPIGAVGAGATLYSDDDQTM